MEECVDGLHSLSFKNDATTIVAVKNIYVAKLLNGMLTSWDSHNNPRDDDKVIKAIN